VTSTAAESAKDAGAGAKQDAPSTVAVLRDVPEERRMSMERFADEIVNGLLRGGDVHPCPVTVHTTTTDRARWRAVPSARAVRFAGYPLRVAMLAARRRADLFHIVDQGYADLAALLPKDRTLVTCHDLMLLRAEEGVAGFRGRRSTLARFRWSTSFLSRVAHVACDSECTRTDAIRLCGVQPERTSVIPLGVRPMFAPLEVEAVERLRAALGTPPRHRLLHVSSGPDYKNAATTIRVLAALRRGGADVGLVRAGTPLAPKDRALCESLGVADHVTDLHHVSDVRLVELYNACDVLVFPSFYEGFGLPVLEAMACGTPVAASNTPALVALADAVALFADPLDVDGHTANVQALLESPTAARERGLARAASYTWERTVRRYTELYRTVLDGR
jgi:glycosyltransferase involved in cell wall biosynthesis